jgi:phosphoribosylformylglycinamidine (FGAM) synthase-like enzyme
VGGSLDLVAGLDNFCWCDPVLSDKTPDGPYKMAQLVRANQALYDVCVAYNLPLVSGKDSMKNDFYDGAVKISIPPTLLFSVIGKIEDARKAVTMDAKRPGDIVYLLGKTGAELGASEYFALQGVIGSGVPTVDTAKAYRRYQAYHRAVMAGTVASCHDLSDGGLAVAAAESAFAGGCGMAFDLSRVLWKGDGAGKNDATLLFSESASRHLVTVHPEMRDEFEEIMTGNCFASIGSVTAEPELTVTGMSGDVVIRAGLAELKEAWQKTLREL